MKKLPNYLKRLQEQREWMRAYEQLKAWEEIVVGSDDEEELLRQITRCGVHLGPVSRRQRGRIRSVSRRRVLSLE